MNAAELLLLLKAQDQSSSVIAGVRKAYSALSDTFVQAAQAAAEDEANIVKLQQAVENSGASWVANKAIIEERIKAGQNLAFTDTQVRDSLAILTAQTGSLDEAMKRQSLAMDFARGAGIGLEQASKLMGKVTEENVRVFARYGITVKAGAGETELFAEMQKRFGGQAEAYGATTAAAIFKVKDATDEWKESLGTSLGPATSFIALLPGMTSGVSLAKGAVVTAVPALIGFAGTLMTTVIPAAAATVVALAPILIPLAAIALAVGVLALAWSNNWGDIQGKTMAVIGFISGPIQGLISLVQGAIEWLSRLGGAQVSANLGGITGGGSFPADGSEGAGPIFAANGFDGTVSRPTMFVAGEAGTEHVRITPGGSRSGGGMTVHVEVHGSVVGIGDLEDRVRSAVRDGLGRGGFRGVGVPA